MCMSTGRETSYEQEMKLNEFRKLPHELCVQKVKQLSLEKCALCSACDKGKDLAKTIKFSIIDPAKSKHGEFLVFLDDASEQNSTTPVAIEQLPIKIEPKTKDNDEITMVQVPNAPIVTYSVISSSSGKNTKIVFPEVANISKAIKALLEKECILEKLSATLSEGQYLFKMLSGDGKNSLRLLCCLPEQEILLSYKDNNCEVTAVNI